MLKIKNTVERSLDLLLDIDSLSKQAYRLETHVNPWYKKEELYCSIRDIACTFNKSIKIIFFNQH